MLDLSDTSLPEEGDAAPKIRSLRAGLIKHAETQELIRAELIRAGLEPRKRNTMRKTITDSEILSFQLTNDYVVVYTGDEGLEYDRACGIALVGMTEWRLNESGVRTGEPLHIWREMMGLEFEAGGEEFVVSGEATNYVGVLRVSDLTDEQKAKLR